MTLTEKELAIISKAELAVKRMKIQRAFLLLVMLAALVGTLFGIFAAEDFAYLAIFAVLFGMGLPNMGRPSYNQLVGLLIRVRAATPDAQQDPLIKVLTQKP